VSFLNRTPDDVQASRDEIASLNAEFGALRASDSDRLQRYADFREEAESTRTMDPALAADDDYGRRSASDLPKRHNIGLPFGQALTVKHAHRMSARMPEVIVDRRQENPQERYRSDRMEKIVWAIIRESKGEAQFASASWDGSQLGASCFEVYFDIDKELPCFRALDPAGVMVVKGADDPHNFLRFYKFWDAPVASVKHEYRNKTFRGRPVDIDAIQSSSSFGGIDRCTIVQVGQADSNIRFVLGENPVPLYENPHRYGFVPYVVIPNLGPERRVWGWSDYEFIRDVAAYVSKNFSREADVIRSTANGAYVEERTGQSPEAVEAVIGKGGVLPSRQAGKVTPIDPPQMPDFATAHADRGMLFLKYLGFAPDAAWGDGAAGSGSDRGLQMQPMNELTALKRVNWASGLGRLFSMAYRMIEEKQVGTTTYRGTVQKAGRREPFIFDLTPGAPAAEVPNPDYNPDAFDTDVDETVDVPQSPKELFDKDYEVRFSWQNRIDPDDPAFVASELNKFQQGTQSLRTTLERTGCDSPEDEMKLIEQEAERFPWLRAGLIALTKAQLDANQQGEGGGGPTDPGAGIDDAVSMMTGKDGSALDGDAMTAALGPDSAKPLYGGA